MVVHVNVNSFGNVSLTLSATGSFDWCRYEAHVETYSIPVVFPGSGSLSQPVSCVTVEGAPSEPPTNLEAATLGFDHVEVRWTPPRVSAGQVIGYRLFYDVAETESYAEVEVPASVTSYTATLLDPDTTYRFQVLAFTAAGEGPISDTLVCQTLESAKSRMTRLTTGEAVASPSPSPSKPVSRRSSVRAPSAEAESPINDEVATAQDDWQQLRHTGAHRKARPLIESWVKDDTAWHEARPDRPQPRELSESRPGGAIRGYEPQRVITGTQDRRPKIKSTWVAVDDDDREVVLSPAGKKVPLRNTTMEDRFLEQLKSGPVDFDPPRSQKPSDGGDSAPSSAIDQSETKKKGRGNWIANPSKPAEPTSVEPPSKLERQTSARVKTAAELTGEAMLVAIEGNIRVRGEIRGKRNAVRAKLEVMTERTRPVDEKATWLKGLFETENNAGALVMYTTSNTVIRETYSVCNEILKLFDLLRLKISKKDVYLDPGVSRATHVPFAAAGVASWPLIFVWVAAAPAAGDRRATGTGPRCYRPNCICERSAAGQREEDPRTQRDG